jgi:hypothetical protein
MGFISRSAGGDIIRSARGVAWTAAIFLYLIAINYSGEAIIIALNWDRAYEDFARLRCLSLLAASSGLPRSGQLGASLRDRPSSAPHSN